MNNDENLTKSQKVTWLRMVSFENVWRQIIITLPNLRVSHILLLEVLHFGDYFRTAIFTLGQCPLMKRETTGRGNGSSTHSSWPLSRHTVPRNRLRQTNPQRCSLLTQKSHFLPQVSTVQEKVKHKEKEFFYSPHLSTTQPHNTKNLRSIDLQQRFLCDTEEPFSLYTLL